MMYSVLHRVMSLAVLAALSAAPAPHAQTPLHLQVAAQSGVNLFGHESADGVGDVDGDGVPDYAVGARADGNVAGYVRVYSGATGQTLATLTGNGGPDRFGCSVAGVGDLNGDQVPDILVGANADTTYGVDKGLARVISGSDWSVLREHTGTTTSFGTRVSAMGDANGDGVSEYLVVERWDAVSCFNGADGGLLWKYVGGFWDAVRVSHTAGDVNGDGVADALIGAPFVSATPPPYVLVLDGASGAEIHRILGVPGTSFGSSVSWIGDLNGDQCSEFAAGVPHAGPGSPDLVVHDGASGAFLYGLTGAGQMGNQICGMGDQDGDGIPDFAAADGGQAKLYSGADGSTIHACDPTPMVDFSNATTWLAAAGDLDGDGAQELLNGTYSSSGLAAGGAVVVFSSASHPLPDLGFALGGPGGTPLLVAESDLRGGSLLRVDLANAAVWSPVVLVLGVTAIQVPFLGGTMVPSPDLAVGGLSADGTGRYRFSAPLPPGIPAQSELYLQYWIVGGGGPAGVTASNAVKAVFP